MRYCAVIAAVVLLVTGMLRPASARVPVSTSRAAVHLKTIFLIVLENYDWKAIKGSASAPFINHTLLPQASHAERYYNPPGVHPSLPNYLWLEGGSSFGVTDDGPPAVHGLATHAHFTTLLTRAGISWRTYQEGISGTGCPLSARDGYAPKHDPFVYFDDVQRGRSSYCQAHVRPLTQLAGDLHANAVSHYNFITPNLCHDMHDPCSPLDDRIRQGDRWLSAVVPRILQSQAYRRAGALLITWDEGVGDDGPVGLMVLSPFARGHGYRDMTHYNHSSTLRTLEEIFGVRPFLGDARRAHDLRGLFRTFP